MIVLIGDIENGKSEIYTHLAEVRGNPQRAHELVELLESETDLSREFPNRKISTKHKADLKKYFAFCEAYIIYLFNNFIVADEDTEIMLVAFNYLPAYAHEKRAIQRRALYAREVYEPRHPEKNWSKSDEAKSRDLYGEESRIMKGLSEVLAELAIKQGGTLKLVKDVLVEQEAAKTAKTIVDVLPGDTESDRLSGVNAPSQLIPLMRVEQTEGAHQNSDFDKGELSLVPEVFVNNRADATNITHVHVVVVMPETTNTTVDTRKQSSIEPKTIELAPQPKTKRLPSPKPAPIPRCPPKKSFWFIILALIITGLGVICLIFFHPSDSKEPDSTTVVSPENAKPSSGTTDASDNSGPGHRVYADENNDPGHTIENSSPRNNVQE